MSKIYDNIGDVAGRLLAISIKAKDFATEMTRVNVLQKDLNGMPSIEKEHIDNNKAVRDMLLSRDIVLEHNFIFHYNLTDSLYE